MHPGQGRGLFEGEDDMKKKVRELSLEEQKMEWVEHNPCCCRCDHCRCEGEEEWMVNEDCRLVCTYNPPVVDDRSHRGVFPEVSRWWCCSKYEGD